MAGFMVQGSEFLDDTSDLKVLLGRLREYRRYT